MSKTESGKRNNLYFLGWLVASYVISLPMQFQTGLGLRFAPSDLFLLLILLFAVGKLKLRETTWSIWHFGLILVFALGTYVTLMTAGHLSSYVLIQKDIGLIALILGYVFFTTYVHSWSGLRQMMQIFLISVTLQNVFALGIYVSGVELSWMNQFYPRLSGMLVDPNAYGGLLVVAFAFHVVTFYGKQPLIGGLWGILTTITLAVGILLTFSRSAWIGMAFVMLMTLIVRPSYAWRMLTVFGVATASILMIFGKSFIDVMTNMASRPEQIQSRLNILHGAVDMFAESPLFGVGIGTFAERGDVIIHNTPAWFLTEFGLFGCFVFIGFIGWFIVKALYVYRNISTSEKPLVMALLLAHISMFGLSLGIEAFYQRHWWLIFALIASAYTIRRKEASALAPTWGENHRAIYYSRLNIKRGV